MAVKKDSLLKVRYFGLWILITLAVGCTRPLNDWHYQSLLHPPAMLFSPLAGPYTAGATVNLSWVLTALNTSPTQSFTVEVSSDGGSSWSFAGYVPVVTTRAVSSYPYSFTWTTPSWNTTQAMFRVSYTDSLGISGSGVSSAFTVDSTSPTIPSGLFLVNGGSSAGLITTTNNYVQVSLQASDNLTNITHYCFKYFNVSGTPSLTDSCWTAVNTQGAYYLTPSINLNLSNYPYHVGFITGTYTVYAWVRDAAGNISSNSGTLGTDKADIYYVQYPSPLVINSTATNTDTPSTPILTSELDVVAGSTLYIKWNATPGAGTSLTATPISLYYTTDDIHYTLIASGLSNAGQGGCTVTAGKTGCYAWTPGNLLTTYFRVRVTAQDVNGQISVQSAQPLNVGSKINILAGNADPGHGGSATAAMFINQMGSTRFPDNQTFVVTDAGEVYFRDLYRGILKVSPTDGVQQIFIPMTGASTGDGGAATSATLKLPFKIALDFQNRLLIFDYNRIRRVDLNQTTPTISTIIGGGASTLDTDSPLNVKIIQPSSMINAGGNFGNMIFTPMPNGDLYFQSENYVDDIAAGYRIRLYQASTGQVTTIRPSGTGLLGFPGQDITTECQVENAGLSFDPVSSAVTSMQLGLLSSGTAGNCALGLLVSGVAAIDPTTYQATTPYPPKFINGADYYSYRFTGMDGNLYNIYTNGSEKLGQYDPVSNTWTTIAGIGVLGSCSDGTAPTACALSLQDAFVSSTGQVYIMDRGRLRAIDQATGTLVTLMGQPYSFGDGGQPNSARFGSVFDVDQLDSGDFIVLDQEELKIRQFTPGTTISTLAGDGGMSVPNTVNPASSQSIFLTSYYVTGFFGADPTNGDIYFNRGNTKIARLDHTTGLWVDVVGGGGTAYYSADTLTGANVGLGWNSYSSQVIGFDRTNNQFLAGLQHANVGSTQDVYLKLYSTVDGTQTGFAGISGTTTYNVYCPAGTALGSCYVPVQTNSTYMRTTYDSFGAQWALMSKSTTSVYGLPVGGPNMSLITTTAVAAISYTYRHDAGSNIVYYCGSDGVLHKKDINAATDTAYSWPISNLDCVYGSLLYNSTRNSLIFPFVQNGLYGVAEYTSP